jgi:EpsI family protein
MPSKRMAFVLAGMMLAASIGAIIAKPTRRVSDVGQAVRLDTMIPSRFGEWREDPRGYVQVVNPQTKELLDKLYSQVLSRVYVGAGGYRIMLSIAYGTDQRGSLQAHKPEVCYPAQGFVLKHSEASRLVTVFGTIPVRRLFAEMGARQEPVTYWFTIGDEAVQGKLQKRLAELRYGLTGLIPDGLLFRVSSIDPDPARAYRRQDRFVDQLLQAVSPAARKRLSGLGDA